MKKLSKATLLKRLEKTFDSKILGKEAVDIVKDYDINHIKRIVNRAEMFRINIPNDKKDLDYKDFRKFPKSVQKEIISVLAAYNECHVNFEFGKWDITPDTCIKSSYGKDHRVFGTFEYDKLVDKIKGLKVAREKYREDFSKIDVDDSFWA